MPVKIDVYRDVDEDVRGRVASGQTKEAATLEALSRVDTPASRDDLEDEVAFGRSSLSSAVYRLREKDLLVEGEDGIEFAGEDAARLAEAFIVNEELLA